MPTTCSVAELVKKNSWFLTVLNLHDLYIHQIRDFANETKVTSWLCSVKHLIELLCEGFVSLVSSYLQMVLLARRPHHVPLAAGLLRGPVVDATAEASAHLIVRVLQQVFR